MIYTVYTWIPVCFLFGFFSSNLSSCWSSPRHPHKVTWFMWKRFTLDGDHVLHKPWIVHMFVIYPGPRVLQLAQDSKGWEPMAFPEDRIEHIRRRPFLKSGLCFKGIQRRLKISLLSRQKHELYHQRNRCCSSSRLVAMSCWGHMTCIGLGLLALRETTLFAICSCQIEISTTTWLGAWPENPDSYVKAEFWNQKHGKQKTQQRLFPINSHFFECLIFKGTFKELSLLMENLPL